MNIAIKCALIEAGIMKLEAEEPDIKELKTLMTSCEKLQQRTVKGKQGFYQTKGITILLSPFITLT